MPEASRKRVLMLGECATLLDGVQDALFVTDSAGAVVFMNEAAKRLHGFADRVESGNHIANLLDHVREVFEIRTLDGRAVADGDQPVVRALRGEPFKDVELLVRRVGDDDARVCVFNGSVIEGDAPLSLLTVRDETDRYRSERRYRVAFEADPAPSVIVRLSDLRILDSNEGMAGLTGLAKDDLEGGLLTDLDPRNQNDALYAAVEGLKDGTRLHKLKCPLVASDGSEKHVLVSARAIEVDGRACAIFTYLDISELEAVQRELQASVLGLRAEREHAEAEAARWASVLEQAPSLTAVLEGPDHLFVAANERYVRFFGDQELLGRRLVDVMPEVEAQGVIALLDQVYSTVAGLFDGRVLRRARDGDRPGSVGARRTGALLLRPRLSAAP
ncbi:MAG: PAS domain-containing protein [Trueperaceae bacterium]|nr:PAS domain-containing protein [Trueperaceae bacterium]